jgi:hypothetical protein
MGSHDSAGSRQINVGLRNSHVSTFEVFLVSAANLLY